MDNLNTHGRKSLIKRYGEKLGGLLWQRFTHYTPKHGSWLNHAEIEASCSAACAWDNAEFRTSPHYAAKFALAAGV